MAVGVTAVLGTPEATSGVLAPPVTVEVTEALRRLVASVGSD